MKKGKFSVNLDDVKKKLEEEKNKQSYNDDRFWKLKMNFQKSPKSSAIIRFLPSKEGELYKKIYRHSFDYIDEFGDKKYVIGVCPTTFGNECLICKEAVKKFNSKYESDKEEAKVIRKKTRYISNILVIKDPANPENEGKIFLFEYGRKIFDKIQSAIEGDLELGEEPINVFSPYDDGANFYLVAKMKDGYVNYDDSKFKEVKAVFDDIDKVDKLIEEQTYVLDEVVTPEWVECLREEVIEKYVEFVSGKKLNKDKEEIKTEDLEDEINELENENENIDNDVDEDDILDDVDDLLDD